jgi:nucleotide-binding universal stress UspA family protein
VDLIVACDGRESAAFLAVLARVAPLTGTRVSFVHVLDPAAQETWERMAGHHWLRRPPDHQERDRFAVADEQAAREILEEALSLSADWPTASRETLVLRGNPERELVRLALSRTADLVALGQHRVELGPHALGQCARYVIDHAPCPVLLVRDDALRAQGAALLGDRLDHGPPARRPHR